MIIPRKHAMKAIESGNAKEVGICTSEYAGAPDGRKYVIVDRYDHQRVDHYPATDKDLDRLESANPH
jgi:hypothetical protein